MRFTELSLKGAYLIELAQFCDERGYFMRSFCKKEFEKYSLCTDFVQHSISDNYKKGTLRGLHYQKHPYEEIKIVSCLKGAVYDVILDLRKYSTSYKQWLGFKLNENNKKMLYIPKGFAHGFLTLEDNTLISYYMSDYFNNESYMGIRYNDKDFNIEWIQAPEIISEKDSNYEDFQD